MEFKPKNREWVKNAAIVFLAVLLVLTFFSNTIMNRTLPEVATVAVQDGSIVAKVRGTGTVKANGSHDVKATQTREISAVMVKVGQEVQTGDTLFVLGSGDSEELETAKETLKELQYSYQKQAINLPTFNTSQESAAYREALASFNAADAAFLSAQNAYNAAVSTSASEADKAALATAEAKLKTAAANLDKAEANLNSLQTEYDAAIEMLTEKLAAWQEVVNRKIAESISNTDGSAGQSGNQASGTAMKKSSGRYVNLAANSSNVTTVIVIPSKDYGDPSNTDNMTIEQATNWRDICADAIKECESINQATLDKAQSEYDKAQTEYDKAQTAYDAAYAKVDETQRLAPYSAALSKAEAEYYSAKSALETAQDNLNYTNSSNEKTLASASIDLQQLADKIKTQQEKVKQLSGESGDEITANVNGTVTSISVSAGDTVTKDTVLCTIEVPDMGYTLSFSVTNDQAQRLRVGDTATVSNYYWGKEIVATLSTIATDPKNPQTNKTLTFDLSGDVSSGSELTISVGQKSANYDTIVPNSAIRSDSNGQFVLAIQAKSSPLGNRYIAKRVSVEVLASDDDNSAVVADLGWGDYVITTSSSPVQNGDQVRMAESG